jgi:hypothetical protein
MVLLARGPHQHLALLAADTCTLPSEAPHRPDVIQR